MNEPRRPPEPSLAAGGWTDPDATDAADPVNAWDTLATGLGGLPRVLLRDTDADGDAPSGPPTRPGSTEMPAPANAPRRLQLLGEIARGGMGAILKGRDPDLSRDLAVKVLLDRHRDDPDLLRRFVEEAQIAGQLQHPGIVPVYRLGTLPDRRPYFTMKLVRGRTLAALLAERDVPVGWVQPTDAGRGQPGGLHPPYDDLPRFVSIFEQVCRTMAYAHSRGVIHRDLKPSNIMVGGFGEVQVMDWGLAKVLAHGEAASRPDEPSRANETVVATARSGSAGSDLSRAGSVIGTPAYMAPEQARGEVHRVEARADVFALGAILCEVLTGRPPYVGRTTAEVQRKAARGDTAEALAATEASGADPELIAVARDCLAAEPEDRPADARAVADRVASHLAGVGERLRRAEVERVAEAARAEAAEAAGAAERRARRLTLGLAAAILMLIGLAGGGSAWLESERAARRAATERAVAVELRRARDLQADALAAPPDQPGPWAEALAAARGAEDRIRGGESDEATRQQVAMALKEIERDRLAAEDQAARITADRRLLSRLESVRGNRAEHGILRQTDAEYAAAFRDAGLDLDVTDPERAGAWIAARSAPVELASFLDDWALVRRAAGAGETFSRRLAAAARAADPDFWRDALRAGLEAKGPEAVEALRKLAGDEEVLDAQPAESLRLLAWRLKAAGDRGAAARVLRRAWRRRPDDFWVNFELALATMTESAWAKEAYPRPEEAVRHLTAALAVRRGSATAHTNLGIALHAQGRMDEAIAEHRAAIRLQPDDAAAHINLGAILCDVVRDYDGAIAEFRTAIRLLPDDVTAHYNLGTAMRHQGKLAEAIAEYRETIRLQPDDATVHTSLGIALRDRGKLAEAIIAYREAIRLQPDYAVAHYNLGITLRDRGKQDEAIAEYREAIRLQPDYAEAHCNLGQLLQGQGHFPEALAEYRRGHELGSMRPGWHYPSAEWVRGAERLAALAARLPAVIRGEDKPKDAGERLALADMAYKAMCHGLSARLFTEVLKADPKLADDRQARHRYNAACAAALAGCGQARDDPLPDEAARADLRKQAFDWLRAELAAWGRVLDTRDPQALAGVERALRHWKEDSDLAGVRDPTALARFPEPERKEWRALWADVERLIRRAGGGQP